MDRVVSDVLCKIEYHLSLLLGLNKVTYISDKEFNCTD